MNGSFTPALQTALNSSQRSLSPYSTHGRLLGIYFSLGVLLQTKQRARLDDEFGLHDFMMTVEKGEKILNIHRI